MNELLHPDLFLNACGAPGPWHLELQGPGAAGVVRTFDRPCVVVGRDPAADLVLNHPEISRRHAYLQIIAGRLFCIDLQSRTGTHWDDGPRPRGWVVGRRGIRIGPFRLRPQDGLGEAIGPSGLGADAAAPTSRAFDPTDLPETILDLLGAPADRSEWRMDRVLVLMGRASTCKLHLGNSRFHGGLVRTPAGVWVVNLLGGFLSVAGTPVRAARLEDGKTLEVGGQLIRLRCGSPPVASGRTLVAQPAAALPARITPTAQTLQAMLCAVPEAGRDLAEPQALSESALLPVLREMGQMQQQMADQFQQALLMMFRMFSDMHQDQMGLIREELSRIAQLTEEQKALQAELARRQATPGPTPSDSWPALRVIPADEHDAHPAPGPETGTSPESDHPVPPPRTAPATADDKGSGPSRTAEEPTGDQLHSLLVQRLTAIQNERQGRWQRLLNSVMGKSTG